MYSVVNKNVGNTTTTNSSNTVEEDSTKCQELIEPQQPTRTNEDDNLPSDNGNNVKANDRRRDSTQVWTPLLDNGIQNTAAAPHETQNNTKNGSNENMYTGEHSNNNDWNGDEMKTKGLVDNTLNRSNNNGPVINGKNGTGLLDKCDELDPLTGLYKEKPDSLNYVIDDKCIEEDGCGLFGCKPKWARSLASTHMFMVVFLLAYILQGMYMTYFVSVITTIEKLFQIKSKTTGFLLSASEMGQISTAMLLTYFAGRGHRPRWIACGMVLFSIAAFACALPHFIFGKELIQSTALMSKNGQQNLTNSDITNSLAFHMDDFVSDHPFHNNSTSTSSIMAANHQMEMNLCQVDNVLQNSTTECNEDRKLEQVSQSKITVIVLCIFFGSLLSSGIGQTAVSTLGIPYIDDNVASKQSAMYMAITIGVRILGPASGFIVGSVCTRWYVNFTNPGFDASDPRWIGAWWLGPVVIGSLMLLSSIAMFSFPKQLRGKKPTPPVAEKSPEAKDSVEIEEKPRLKDFPKTVKRQLSNDILMFRTASCVFHLLPIAGLYTFLPKYLETQFRLAPYDANMVAAFCGILVMGIGIICSGLVIFKFKPTARAVAAWIALTALIYSAGMVILMFVGCNMNEFAGYKPATSSSPAVIEPVCSAVLNCTCDKEQFAPICGVDGKIYISSCHAGCSVADVRSEDNHTVFSQCSCISDSFMAEKSLSYEAVGGYCDNNCKNFIIFIVIFAICVFTHSTSEVGSMLLVMRCTHPKDKAMAMGLIQSAIGLFGNVPCPIIYGAVVDSACLIWRSVCGKHGACSLYDADTFRHYFLGITAGIMFLAFIMDLVVWSKAHRIDIAPEENNVKQTNESDCEKPMSESPDTSV